MLLVAQITAIAIFILMFAAILSEKFERHIVSLVCGAAMLIIVVGMMVKDYEGLWKIMAFDEFVDPNFWYQKGELAQSSGINWATIIFITGMMIMVEVMAESGVFQRDVRAIQTVLIQATAQHLFLQALEWSRQEIFSRMITQ